MARRAAYLDSFKKQYPGAQILHLDAGGLARPMVHGQEQTMQAIMQSYAAMGIQAINVSSRDIVTLKDAYFEMSKEAEIPFISANVYNEENGELLFPSYLIVESAGSRIGIIGATQQMGMQEGPISGKRIAYRDPVDSVKKLIPEVRQKADIVVVMIYLHFTRLRGAVDELRDADIIIGADGYTTTWNTLELNNTWVSYGGRQGQKLMLLACKLKNSRLRWMEQRIMTLRTSMPEKASIKAIVDAAKRDIEATRTAQSWNSN